jgi:hypothetical protein
MEPGEELVYGQMGDTDRGVVIPRRYADQLRIQLEAKTWGELRAGLPVDVVEEMLEGRPGAAGTDSPPDDAPYAPEQMFGWDDADFPDWPQQRMLDWVPEDLLERHIGANTSVLNGDYADATLDDVEALVRDLEALGFSSARDDRLISFVCRYDDASGTGGTRAGEKLGAADSTNA